ncbi:unnamed protein product, partial [Meganyctiphanes norvegica]
GCKGDDIWIKDCKICFSSNGATVCTGNLCMDDQGCKGNVIWIKDCRICFSSNGATVCTANFCRKNQGRCPNNNGFILSPDGKKCFKSFTVDGTWGAAVAHCKAEGLVLAHPDDGTITWLQRQLHEYYGNTEYWVNARGKGRSKSRSSYQWLDDGTEMTDTYPLWFPGRPVASGDSHFCVSLGVWSIEIEDAPVRPYVDIPCTKPWARPLCEGRCSKDDGFFPSPDGKKCFKSFPVDGTWNAAVAHCKVEGLVLAHPEDDTITWIQRHLFENYGDAEYWVHARGIGPSSYQWMDDGSELTATDQLWSPGKPQTNGDSHFCVSLAAWSSNIGTAPGQPYRDAPCSWFSIRPLCEARCQKDDGFFLSPDGKKCYKSFAVDSTWDSAVAHCKAEGLVLAHPDDSTINWLQRYLYEHYGNGNYGVNARGTGRSSYQWRDDGTELTSTNPSWFPGNPISKGDPEDCVSLGVWPSLIKAAPGKPYGVIPCSWFSIRPLCEVVGN